MINRSLVFDLDGVMVDSELHWKAIESDFLSGLIQGWGPEDQKRVIGMSAYDVHDMLVRDYGLTGTRQDFVGYYDAIAGEIYGNRVSLLAGFLNLYRELNSRGVRLGVASSSPKPWIETVLERFGLDAFKAVVSSDDVGCRGKPAPDVYLLALKQLGAAPEESVAIEDTEKGILSARGAGMHCVGLNNGFHEQDLSEAELVVASLEELNFDLLERNFWRT